jgi:hypothetical protein
MSGCGPKNIKFKTAEAKSKAELRKLNIIDKFLNILDYPNFVKKNREWTESAKKRFGVSGKLFYEENNKALPNKEAFKKIDNSNGVYYQITPEVKNQQILLQQEERKTTPAPAPLITKIRKILLFIAMKRKYLTEKEQK